VLLTQTSPPLQSLVPFTQTPPPAVSQHWPERHSALVVHVEQAPSLLLAVPAMQVPLVALLQQSPVGQRTLGEQFVQVPCPVVLVATHTCPLAQSVLLAIQVPVVLPAAMLQQSPGGQEMLDEQFVQVWLLLLQTRPLVPQTWPPATQEPVVLPAGM
jgi:hypothetical protein